MLCHLRLEQERKQQASALSEETSSSDTAQKSRNVTNSVQSVAGVENFQMKGAPPGTEVPGVKVVQI